MVGSILSLLSFSCSVTETNGTGKGRKAGALDQWLMAYFVVFLCGSQFNNSIWILVPGAGELLAASMVCWVLWSTGDMSHSSDPSWPSWETICQPSEDHAPAQNSSWCAVLALVYQKKACKQGYLGHVCICKLLTWITFCSWMLLAQCQVVPTK